MYGEQPRKEVPLSQEIHGKRDLCFNIVLSVYKIMWKIDDGWMKKNIECLMAFCMFKAGCGKTQNIIN